MFTTPISPWRALGLFISLFIPRGQGVLHLWLCRSGLMDEDRDVNLPLLPPKSSVTALAGCVTRDVSKSYRCSGW